MPQDMETTMVFLFVIALMVAAIWKAGYPFLNRVKLGCIPQDMPSVLGRKFFVIVAGNTNGAHRPIVAGFKSAGQTEVMSPAECDYLLVFCPVASRVGTDISEALDHIPAGKQAVLVVMHHTFNHRYVIAASSRLVQNPNIVLTVDCLFHENKLLSCDLNNKMWSDVYNVLGVCQFSLRIISSRSMLVLLVFVLVVAGYIFFNEIRSGFFRYMPQDMDTAMVFRFVIGLMMVAAIWKAGYPFLNRVKLGCIPQAMQSVLGRKFFVIVAGNTNGAHRPIVDGFKSAGQTEVMFLEQCDYLLVFCPVASRVGTDISEALDHIPADKKALLLVMHHTFDCHHVIAASSRLVENPNILLTEDRLFHESELLSCDLNDKMWYEVYNFLGVSQAKTRFTETSLFSRSIRYIGRKCQPIALLALWTVMKMLLLWLLGKKRLKVTVGVAAWISLTF